MNKQKELKLDESKKILVKWMEKNNIEEIKLRGRNEVICKKCNNSGSLLFGGDFVPLLDNKELPEIPETCRTKINGVDIGLFFEKIGKSCISRQELGINEVEVERRFNWTPWIIAGTLISFGVLVWLMLSWKQREKKG